MIDITTTEAWRHGVATALASVPEVDENDCQAMGDHDPMPCGCCWHEPGHIIVGHAELVCPA